MIFYIILYLYKLNSFSNWTKGKTIYFQFSILYEFEKRYTCNLFLRKTFVTL